ncbi:cell division protein ZapA [Sphingosinicella terrae]|uniref:cell division protein ZapA n=1 Tax=Sphingosinicella terrae TaxID=2172047 RepID=UPI000E0DFDBA|nr:cell division protein ZapA [Sphingosinicella terrae]
MAHVDLDIAGRRYSVACRDGEEAHLRGLAALVDRKAQEATEALGSLTEARQLLFAALLIADELKEVRAGAGLPDPTPPPPDPAVAEALERLAGRLENLAVTLEPGAERA